MGQSLILTDQSGGKISRFGAAGVRRALTSPVAVVDGASKDYAMVWCEAAEVYISRYGKGARSCEFVVTHWDSADPECPPQELTYENKDREKAIKQFLTLCKRDPLYEDAPA